MKVFVRRADVLEDSFCFFGNIVCNVPSDVFCFHAIGDQFHVVICPWTLQNCWTPVVKIPITVFRTPHPIRFNPVIFCQRKGSFPFTDESTMEKLHATTLMNLYGMCQTFLGFISKLVVRWFTWIHQSQKCNARFMWY